MTSGEFRETSTVATPEQALFDGHQMRAFSSGGGLRVVRIEDQEGTLVGYGEAPQIEDALSHASENYVTRETYQQQYSGEGARYPHYMTGTTEISSPLDGWVRWGHDFKAYADGEDVVVELGGSKHSPEIPKSVAGALGNSTDTITIVERGVSYRLTGNGNGMTSIEVVDNPEGKSHYWQFTKTGRAASLIDAVDAAFSAEEVEK